MSRYQRTDSGVLDTQSSACIPSDPNNRDWQEYQEWLAAGNTPDPMPLVDLKAAKKAEIKAAFSAALDAGMTCANGIKMDADMLRILRLKGGHDLARAAGASALDVRDFDNVVHTAMPLADVWQMILDLGANYQSLLAHKWAIESQVDAVIDPATAEADLAAIAW